MEQFIRDKRKSIDAVIIAVSEIGSDRELALVKTTLQRSQMFLGLVLGSIVGISAAYPKGNDVSTNEIDARGDQADFKIVYPTYADLNELAEDYEGPVEAEISTIQKIKFLRQYIQQDCINSLEDKWQTVTENSATDPESMDIYSRIDMGSFEISVVALKEAKMWLGQELDTFHKFDTQYQNDLQTYDGLLLRAAGEAYERYGNTTDFKNFQGNPMPKFDELPEKIVEAWKAVVTPMVQQPSNYNWFRLDNNAGSQVGRGF